MEFLRIELENREMRIKPLSTLEGHVEWALEKAPEKIELRLLWFTEGRGSRDIGVVSRRSFENQPEMGRQSFSIKTPEGPYSFEGRLITLRWILEAAVDPGDMVTREDLLFGPEDVPIDLYLPR